ncbi:LysR family transcriptional regulator [Cnuibacter physcomitrellae]|uniref:LysR family transcriptional regulator n=1 Tax=Cnuibacter physcomitrellae TaxID=1619308 RepID=A0A1X9LNI4_9MICO|nr:LysR family transcriptional regulator [Cnuibacter physcomitrellae]ARJ05848.1 LysR family transcriptional regulator [Cnuibacter physcomitrellae]MCS5496418.1 LysR family transcriptional regulator [Cnuibacter physcomitrellae]GGI36626.1 LysR family transcriptional regulator [Cnuibacter physcomitrellae]
MDVRRLELLRELAERGSITEVARATHRTPSAVSQQLRVLEREAGLPLTEKSGRGIVLTDAGRALARSAADIAVAIERAEALWDEFRNDPTGEVSLSTFPTGGQMLLPGLVKRLDSLGGLVLTCADRDVDSAEFPLLTADFDIVLAHSPTDPPQNWNSTEVTAVKLMTEPLDIALPPGHPLAQKEVLDPEDLVGEQWIGVPWGYPFERTIHDISAAAGSPMDVVQRFGDTRVTEAFVAAGLGVAVLPCYTAGGAYRDQIVLRNLRGVVAERHIYALMRPDRAERLAVRTVIDALRAEAAEVIDANRHRNPPTE